MPQKLRIDFVSDIACPWCAVGLAGLERALTALEGEIAADITFHPFELNPDMPPGGQNSLERLSKKYAMSPAQVRSSREMLRCRAERVGVIINASDESRTYNTFDAHRLLAWAKEQGRQLDVKRRLLALNFTDQRDPGNHDALVAAVESVGLDGIVARAVLESDRYGEHVRAEERLWQSRGISSVPAVVVNERYLISGGQPPAEFERQLRAIAAQVHDQEATVGA